MVFWAGSCLTLTEIVFGAASHAMNFHLCCYIRGVQTRLIKFTALPSKLRNYLPIARSGAMTDEPIFICDPPPGPRYVLTVDHALSPDQMVRIKEAFEAWVSNPAAKVAVLEPGWNLTMLPGRYEWPDA